MKRLRDIIGMAALAAILSAGTVYAVRGTAEQGEKLFNDPTLGGSTNETSCASCHPGGKGLEQAGSRTNLAHMINVCIQRPLKGEPLEEDSVEMDSLERYIRSIR
ncbi:MAG: cytochrome c peroxidase [Desulfobulbaceae bacterium]